MPSPGAPSPLAGRRRPSPTGRGPPRRVRRGSRGCRGPRGSRGPSRGTVHVPSRARAGVGSRDARTARRRGRGTAASRRCPRRGSTGSAARSISGTCRTECARSAVPPKHENRRPVSPQLIPLRVLPDARNRVVRPMMDASADIRGDSRRKVAKNSVIDLRVGPSTPARRSSHTPPGPRAPRTGDRSIPARRGGGRCRGPARRSVRASLSTIASSSKESSHAVGRNARSSRRRRRRVAPW